MYGKEAHVAAAVTFVHSCTPTRHVGFGSVQHFASMTLVKQQ